MKLLGLAILFVAMTTAGCGRKTEPVQSSGRPVAVWIADLASPDATLRKKAVHALGHVGTADPAALPAVIGTLKDRDAAVRQAAVLALLAIGPSARDGLPALIDIRDSDPMPNLRQQAAKAIDRIQGR